MLPNNKVSNYTFLDHLEELKARILSSLLIVIITSTTGFFLHKQLINILIKPLNAPLYYTNPTGGFSFIFDISVAFGVILALPYFMYQLYMFIKPALNSKKALNLPIAVFTSYVLVVSGLLYGYFISLPIALDILKKFGYGQIAYLITTDSYLEFVTKYLFGFSVLFQLPLFLVIINYFYKLNLSKLMKFEKWIILVSVIGAAILTPTGDIINQVIMGLPIILLYQISIIIVTIINRTR